ncbi:PE-PGRS family protein [Streptomyces seoulensis]|uniref:McrC family protein n=1 Tax=Streptomyces seoulensis TaxID=73044 RepID=UPI0033B94B46
MPDRVPIRLDEYESARLELDQLTARDVDRLHALQAQRCLTLLPDRTGWWLKADATVGVLVLDRLRITIAPKFAIPGEQLVSWLSYALGIPVPAPARRWSTGLDGYADLVAAALLEQCEQLLREGLRRDYVSRGSVEPVLRGRLDIAAQATRRYGQLDQLHVRTFDREAAIWDNRVLGSALKTASSLTTSADLARTLHSTAVAFPQASTPTAALRALNRIQYTRLNARYRPAHTWARLLLGGGGVTDLLSDRGATADGLLLRMPSLWEAVVRRLGTEAVRPYGGHAVLAGGGISITVQGDLGNVSAFRPDLLLSLPGHDTSQRMLLPVDAKYKRYDRHGVGAADVHQLLTYSVGYAPRDAPSAVIIHPRPGGYAHRSLHVGGPHGGLGVIDILGIDTHALPEEATRWLGSRLR